ncbi:MAG: acetolactate synthase large subunit [Acidimicrobiia bacterium]|nr:acetolactate synthase large subunit [Acidimicrobiia bacterium]NNL27625.1 acetolactate synthase large subunit [Acidimicrobiia bacterium]
MERISISQALIKALEFEGVEVMFGHPGGAILPAYDPLYDSKIRHVLARHEQGAGHMAEGYAQATGRVGVCIATSGPGATNLVTSLANAYMDSIPILAITGQVPTTAIGNDAFQEAHTWGITMPTTKHNYLVTDAAEIPDVIHEAFHLASTGRPGPVLVDLPKDILNTEVVWHDPTGIVDLPGYKPTTTGHPLQVKSAIELIQQSQRPVLYAGGGIIASGAHAELLTFAERANLPVVTTLMARGAFPDTHALHLGMPGMHGFYSAITAMQKSDLLIAIGARFDDRVTGDPSHFATGAKIIHVDIDPAEIGKIRKADVPIVGDARTVLRQLDERLAKVLGTGTAPTRTEWMETLSGWKSAHPISSYEQEPGGLLKPQYVIEELFKTTGGDAIVVAGVGQHQMWAAQLWKYTKPRTWINSGGAGTMGFAVPAAIGAKMGMPDENVWAIDGDGCFQMTMQEMICASTEGIPVKVLIINNHNLGMVRQWQRIFYNERFSASELTDHTPDYVKLAEAMGCAGFRAETAEEVAPVLEKANSINDRPVIVEARVDPDEMVFPMVPAGGSNDIVILSKDDLS